jgi:PKD repeat protein
VLSVSNPESDVTYYWYNSLLGGTPIDSGSSYTINNLDSNSNMTFYVESKNINGCESLSRTLAQINIGVQPDADFIADNTAIQEGQSVNFSDLSMNGLTWEWTFEGGSPETYSGQTPSAITYNTFGIYDVTLVVTNDAGEDTELKIDYIEVFENPPPPAANCAGGFQSWIGAGSVTCFGIDRANSGMTKEYSGIISTSEINFLTLSL